MSQSSFLLVKPVFHRRAWSFPRIADYLRAHVTWQWRLLRFRTKSSKKPWNRLSKKLTSVTFQASRNHNQELSSLFCVQRLPSDRSWQIADLPNLPSGCKRTFSPWGTVPSWTDAFCFVAPEFTIFRSDKFMREDGDQRLQSRQRKHNFFTEALRLSAIVCEPWGLRHISVDNEVDWGSVEARLPLRWSMLNRKSWSRSQFAREL